MAHHCEEGLLLMLLAHHLHHHFPCDDGWQRKRWYIMPWTCARVLMTRPMAAADPSTTRCLVSCPWV